jgi:hypothetical protein
MSDLNLSLGAKSLEATFNHILSSLLPPAVRRKSFISSASELAPEAGILAGVLSTPSSHGRHRKRLFMNSECSKGTRGCTAVIPLKGRVVP